MSDQFTGVNVIVLDDNKPLLLVSSTDTTASVWQVRWRSKVAFWSPTLLIQERIVLKPVRPVGVMTIVSL